MKNIEIKTTTGARVLLNWDNVTYVKESNTQFQDKYREIHFANRKTTVATTETIDGLKEKLS
mgnify:FL=1